ncbi:HAMP domain-containing sensor histidine kinase [Rhodocytophaga aerolata]|uniref:histidine kinase n=1 Tax=Rhodocytophaga aerolata TaxID=455078 RepID=A0ABT8R1X8_9BACT|nr:HAMP domain-containing sensor histidine kinase [Rhodocytophaga aerolata]MDO1446105.1 HAMP domain-containing sensor histidine kinase [Rhodocytophaga aerolata]
MSKKYVFLLIGILVIGCIATARYFIYYGSAGAEEFQLEVIYNRVAEELKIVEKETQLVKKQLESLPQFSYTSAYTPTKYPYYVFTDGKLAFWSDYRFVPPYSSISGNYSLKTFNLTNGTYLVNRKGFVKDNTIIEIFSLLPLSKKYKIENNYLQSTLNRDIIPYKTFEIATESVEYQHQHPIYSPSGQLLFLVQMPDQGVNTQQLGYLLAVISIIIGLTFISWRVVIWLNRLEQTRSYEWGFLILAAYLFSLRAAMLYFNFPNVWVELDLFNSKYYASSPINPSLGDLLLNVIAVAVLMVYAITYFYRSRLYHYLIKLPVYICIGLSMILVILSNWVLYLHFDVLHNIYLHSQLTLDITASIEFSFFKIICIVIFVLTSGIYFIAIHQIGSLFIRINRGSEVKPVIWIVMGAALYLVISYLVDIYYPFVVACNTIYLITIFHFRLPKSLYRFKYSTSIYLFTTGLICAAIGAYAVYNLELRKNVINQQRFGTQLLTEKDILGEYYLTQASNLIKDDPLVKARLIGGSFIAPDVVEQKIKRLYLKGHVYDNYEINILLFNVAGEPIQAASQGMNYWDYLLRYRRERYKTDYPNLFFVNELGGDVAKEYINIIPIEMDQNPVGYVIINLKLKRIVPENVYPELLVDKRFSQSPESQQYSYAVYKYNNILHSEGIFNYKRYLDATVLEDPAARDPGVIVGDYLHVIVDGDDGKRVVVSTLRYPIKSIFSNFSFLFLTLVLIIVLFIVGYTVYYRSSKIETSFATKIQIYLNLAFFLPLFVVSIATISIVSSAYTKNLNTLFLSNAENVSNNLRAYIDGFEKDKISHDELVLKLNQIARYSGSDVNIFDNQGRYIASSQPLIYEEGILAQYINPEAYIKLVDLYEKQVMLAESVGTLNYNSVYVGLRTYDKDRLIGIVSIPFFESKAALNRQIIEVLSTIMNIFTAIFICFLIFSYFASQMLTVPLRLITQKIQKTSLHNYNEPLEWESDDEIGLLVNEYNRMLVKLEESKQALSRSEKESAWREMAQQVAHEIKNPLTPMKLTLQHLQRKLLNGGEVVKDQAEKSFNTLLDQVDTLNDIATSFSAFAKMPIPKEELFDIAGILKKTVELYSNDADVEILTDIPPGDFFVKGDQQMMSRIFTNLILNGIQSVPAGRKPEITVNMQKSNNFIRIEIHDNGKGISESIRNKIFIPNFSTKYAGSGIGLALAKRGVEHAGGKIWFETEEEQGTSFFIELPLLPYLEIANA